MLCLCVTFIKNLRFSFKLIANFQTFQFLCFDFHSHTMVFFCSFIKYLQLCIKKRKKRFRLSRFSKNFFSVSHFQITYKVSETTLSTASASRQVAEWYRLNQGSSKQFCNQKNNFFFQFFVSVNNVKINEILFHGNVCHRVSQHFCVTNGSNSSGSEFCLLFKRL